MSRLRYLVCVGLVVTGGSIAQAQGVSDAAGREAPLAVLSPASLALLTETELPDQIKAPPAQRRRDPLWNGVLIGAALGAAVGLLGANSCANDFGCTGSTWGFLALGAAVGAGLGVAVDAMLSHQPAAVPVRQPGRLGVGVHALVRF